MTQPTSIHSWRQVVSIVLKHFWKSVGLFTAVLLIAVGVVIFAPREYASTAQYMVRLGHESVSLDPVATVGETMGLHMTSDSVVRSTREIASSDALAAKVVERITPQVFLEIDPNKGPSLLGRVKQTVQSLDPISIDEKARITFKKNLSVTSPTQSNVIVVSYNCESPQMAFGVMQVFSEVFLEEHKRINQTQGSFEFFVEQNQVLSGELRRATEALRLSKQSHNISSIDGRRMNLENRLTETQSRGYDNERLLASSRSKIATITAQLTGTPADIELGATSAVNQQTEAALRQQLYDLQIREKELLSRFTVDHPNVVSVQQQLKGVTQIFSALNLNETATSRGMNPVHQELSLQLLTETSSLAAYEAGRDVLDAQVTQLLQELNALNDQEEEVYHLQTELEVARARYEGHAGKLEQARLEFEVGNKRITSIGVIQAPQVNERPASPNKVLVVALGVLAATFSACALPFVIEYFKADIVPQRIVVETSEGSSQLPQAPPAKSRSTRMPVVSGLDGTTSDSEYISGNF